MDTFFEQRKQAIAAMTTTHPHLIGLMSIEEAYANEYHLGDFLIIDPNEWEDEFVTPEILPDLVRKSANWYKVRTNQGVNLQFGPDYMVLVYGSKPA